MKRYVLKPPDSATETLAIDYPAELNSQQYDVVTNASGPSLVLAGAGSGKTRVLIYKVAYLVEHGVSPSNILLVTFTNKAAKEMQNRVELLLKYRPKDTWWGTFHHIANRTLRRFAKHLAVREGYSILDDDDAESLIKSCVTGLGFDKGYGNFPKARLINSICGLARNSRMKIADVIYMKYPYFTEVIEEIKNVFALYTRRKIDSNLIDYDDLLEEWARLLREVPEVQDFFRKKFSCVLIDEYQDTNRLQFELLKSLHDRSGIKNLIAVGDDAQSIYSFRGAEIHNLLDFPEAFPGTALFKLETNYRSTPQILTCANEIIRHNTDQFAKVLKTTKPEGEMPVVVRVRDAYEQALFVSQRVEELGERGVGLREIAILFRAHYQSAELEMELVKRGIPYVIRGGIRFFEQAHIKDILSYLRVLQNGHDEVSWLRLLALYKGIGKKYAETILASVRESQGDFKNILTDSFCASLAKRAREGFTHFQRSMRKVIDQFDYEKRVGEVIEFLLKQDYQNHLLLNFDNAQDRIADINELANMAYGYNSLKDFLADITLREGFKGESRLAVKDESDDFLVLSTVHQAKGLEWKTVFVIGLNEGQFPHSKASGSHEEIEEERRLFYVATTRAKEVLYYVCPMSRLDYRYGHIISRPSLFIEELPKTAYSAWTTCQEGQEDISHETDELYYEHE